MPRFKVATYNAAYYDRPKTGARSDYVTLFEQADIVGFQEAGRNIDKEQIKAVAKEKGFGAYFSPKEAGTPIAWNKAKFELLGKGSKFLSPRTFVGAEGAGPNTMGEKNLVWVKLRHKQSGRIVYFGTSHLTPSIYLAKRRRLHIMQSDRIRDWIKSVKNQVITVGDYNIDAKKDAKTRDPKMPYAKFGRINVISTWKILGYTKLGTHGDRHIDYVWFRNSKPVKAVSHKVLTGLSSDHRALVAEFDYTLTVRKRLALQARRVAGFVRG